MNLDRRIREELSDREPELDPAEFDDRGLFGMLFRVFTGGLRRWAAFGMLLTLVAVALTVWCAIGFFTAPDVDGRVFWGVLALAAFHAVSMFKLWFFMEMNRNSVLREVKRVERAVERGSVPDPD
ncbi:MAG: DUF6768 family protein [Wenzhouxiangellaceae bacterium]|nr:DUF6768 family protein [Wenzhouxiangellaceae bacterium]